MSHFHWSAIAVLIYVLQLLYPFLSFFIPPSPRPPTDDWDSSVTAHFDNRTNILTASIATNTEHYYIESSHRHFVGSHDFHMIAYRGSDLKYNLTRFGLTDLHLFRLHDFLLWSHDLMLGHMTPCFGHMTSLLGHMTPCFGHMTSCFSHTTSCFGHMTTCFGHMTSCFDHVTSFPTPTGTLQPTSVVTLSTQ